MPLRPILCLNGGSSSLKFALFRSDHEPEVLLTRGAAERIGIDGGHLWIRGVDGELLLERQQQFPDHRVAVQTAFTALDELRFAPPVAVGHRLVHGGWEYSVPARVDAKLLATLRQLVPFAPLHLPSEIQVIEAVSAHFPDLPQVACFDTAFHRSMPELAQRFPLPRAFWDEGVRRYGFHGLSYEYIVEQLGSAGHGRVIIAHLGNGASLAAVRNGQPCDTTMGFTPTGGFMMGTRTGDLDPGILVHLLNQRGYNGDQIEQLVNRESGLLGVSGLSPDMRTLLENRESDPHAAQAVDMFCYLLRKHIGALAAVLGGLDILVFTGGIGERAAQVRWQVCHSLAHLGVRLDRQQNDRHGDTISTATSACTVRVIPTNEDLIIARHTRELIFPDARQ